MLDGLESQSIALDSKKDDGTQLVTLDLSKKNNNIGNLRAIHKVKRGVRVMLTTNIDVSVGLTNCTMGIITDIILEEYSRNIRVILVQFDNCILCEEEKINSTYKHVNVDNGPISKVQASAKINGNNSC